MVHDHDYDPSCREYDMGGAKIGECVISHPVPTVTSFEILLEDILVEINEMMVGRHEKYGPGNIAEFGDLGILVRMSDKFARLKTGRENFNDETIENTLDDVIGYALIWKMWVRGDWPGSPQKLARG